MTDVKHLRKVADEVQKHFCVPYAQDIDDAADEIERLREEILVARRNGSVPEAFWLTGHPKTD